MAFLHDFSAPAAAASISRHSEDNITPKLTSGCGDPINNLCASIMSIIESGAKVGTWEVEHVRTNFAFKVVPKPNQKAGCVCVEIKPCTPTRAPVDAV